MAKTPTTIKEPTEIDDDGDCTNVLEAVIGDINDVSNLIQDKNYTQALEDLDALVDELGIARVYLETKAKE